MSAHLELNAQQREIMEQVSRMPLWFCSPVSFAPRRERATESNINSASITLTRLEGRQLGITNHHVLKKFRERRDSGEDLGFQVGNLPLDVEGAVISESEKYDLVVLDLSGLDCQKIRGIKEIPCQFIEPPSWPPELPQIGDFVAFGGFPKAKRVELKAGHFELGSMSSGGTEIVSVQSDTIACTIQVDKCVVVFDRDGRGFEDLAGVSGGPVLRVRLTPIIRLELVGVIYEYHAPWDILRVRPLSLISSDGRIGP